MANIPLVYNVSLSDIQTFKDFGTFQNNFDNFGNDQLVYNISQSFDGKFNYIKFNKQSHSNICNSIIVNKLQND